MAAQPGYNQSPGFLQNGQGIHCGNEVIILPAMDGVPTDGTSGTGVGLAGPGSLICDYTNKDWYINIGTKASPAWIVLGLTS
jgi:hypothetical protein